MLFVCRVVWKSKIVSFNVDRDFNIEFNFFLFFFFNFLLKYWHCDFILFFFFFFVNIVNFKVN